MFSARAATHLSVRARPSLEERELDRGVIKEGEHVVDHVVLVVHEELFVRCGVVDLVGTEWPNLSS